MPQNPSPSEPRCAPFTLHSNDGLHHHGRGRDVIPNRPSPDPSARPGSVRVTPNSSRSIPAPGVGRATGSTVLPRLSCLRQDYDSRRPVADGRGRDVRAAGWVRRDRPTSTSEALQYASDVATRGLAAAPPAVRPPGCRKCFRGTGRRRIDREVCAPDPS